MEKLTVPTLTYLFGQIAQSEVGTSSKLLNFVHAFVVKAYVYL